MGDNGACGPEPVELDPFTNPWALENFAAAILTMGPIRVKADALRAVRLLASSASFIVYQDWDEATQTMTYTVPEQ